jgi:hypothetical protein
VCQAWHRTEEVKAGLAIIIQFYDQLKDADLNVNALNELNKETKTLDFVEFSG